MQPRIEQLEEKINIYWDGVKKVNAGAWSDLKEEEAILHQCQDYVKNLDDRLVRV